jgi:hypothetical protein
MMAENCPKLTRIHYRGNSMAHECILGIAKHCVMLEHILIHVSNIDAAWIYTLIEKCLNLKSVEFSGRKAYNLSGHTYGSSPYKRHTTHEIVRSNTSIRKPTTVCETLQILKIYKCNTLTDSVIRTIADCAPHLTSVAISECGCNPNFVSEYLTEKCQLLMDLSVLAAAPKVTKRTVK